MIQAPSSRYNPAAHELSVGPNFPKRAQGGSCFGHARPPSPGSRERSAGLRSHRSCRRRGQTRGTRTTPHHRAYRGCSRQCRRRRVGDGAAAAGSACGRTATSLRAPRPGGTRSRSKGCWIRRRDLGPYPSAAYRSARRRPLPEPGECRATSVFASCDSGEASGCGAASYPRNRGVARVSPLVFGGGSPDNLFACEESPASQGDLVVPLRHHRCDRLPRDFSECRCLASSTECDSVTWDAVRASAASSP